MLLKMHRRVSCCMRPRIASTSRHPSSPRTDPSTMFTTPSCPPPSASTGSSAHRPQAAGPRHSPRSSTRAEGAAHQFLMLLTVPFLDADHSAVLKCRWIQGWLGRLLHPSTSVFPPSSSFWRCARDPCPLTRSGVPGFRAWVRPKAPWTSSFHPVFSSAGLAVCRAGTDKRFSHRLFHVVVWPRHGCNVGGSLLSSPGLAMRFPFSCGIDLRG